MTLPASEKSTANDLQETVFLFNEGFAAWSDDPQARRDHLGGKGAGLAEMAAAGITVPPGCTIIADVCRDFFARDEQLHPAVFPAVMEKIARIERQLNRRLGDATHPLLLSVRSGSKFSMPGMMDTILNLGLNETTVTALAENTKNPRFAWESFRRFVYSYGHVVRGVEKSVLDSAVARCRERYSAQPDSELSPIALQSVVAELRAVIAQRSGHNIPDAPVAQLREATEAVFRSWNTPRAVYYRTMHSIDHSLGTAVTIQAMVFGNLNDRSATGVCFSRDPSTGQRALFGEFLLNAQGEDVVAGTRTPRPVSELAAVLPEAAEELRSTAARLERHYRDVQDIEFTIEDGKLFILQTRTGKRSAAAAIKIAVDMAAEGLIDTPRALQRVTPHQLQQLLVPSFDPAARAAAVDAGQLLMKGLAASPGAAKGIVVLTPDEAVDAASRGEIPILVREETCPDDIHGIVAAAGVVTARGGMTSHAAVVARGIGKPCIAGCEDCRIDLATRTIHIGECTVRAGDTLSIDGSTGEVFVGGVATVVPEPSPECRTLLSWADNYRRLQVRANADTPLDAQHARENGAQGIGLCRTEHMFMGTDRLPIMRKMILANDRVTRESALESLLPLQRGDFEAIFTAMAGLPVTIRLLDPPLHEFLPNSLSVDREIAEKRRSGASRAEIAALEETSRRIGELTERNPMMGFRGCRLGLVHPEIYAMQVRAILEAAIAVSRLGIVVEPEILIPLVADSREIALVRETIEREVTTITQRLGQRITFTVGTMIEVPRACLVAESLAQHTDFFSFGTNDLTQMSFGFSRDDAEGSFLRRYLEGVDRNGHTEAVLLHNPFEVLDRDGVGELMRLAIRGGRRARPHLKIGLCGEHGGEPASIALCEELRLDYVSCSPFRLAIARLAAAHAAIGTGSRDL